jgi:hypothetical protein
MQLSLIIDTGVIAALIFGMTVLLGFNSLQQQWIWALLVGVWIPVYGLLVTHNNTYFLALIIAFIGAYAVVLISRLFSSSGNISE